MHHLNTKLEKNGNKTPIYTRDKEEYDLLDRYGISVSHMTTDTFHLS